MSATPAEVIPTTWYDDRDVPFFRITTAVFAPGYVAAATALLAGCDDIESEEPMPTEDADDLMVIFHQVLPGDWPPAGQA